MQFVGRVFARAFLQPRRLGGLRSFSSAYDINRIRNVGVMAHIDAGKTTVSEKMLFYAGVIKRIGDVDDGDTVMDFLKEERERGITIQSAAITLGWQNHRINLVDTPGHVDFTVEVERCSRVLDGAVIVFDGVAGVQAQSLTVWRQANEHSVARIAFINKMDRVGASLDGTVEQIRTRLQTTPLVLQYPVIEEDSLLGIIDLISQNFLYFEETQFGVPTHTLEHIPLTEDMLLDSETMESVSGKYLQEVRVARAKLIEAIAEVDDKAADLYLKNDTLSVSEIHSAIKRATHARSAVAVLCGSAKNHIGIQPVMDAIVEYLPPPNARPYLAFPVLNPGKLHGASRRKDGSSAIAPTIAKCAQEVSDLSPEAPLVALAFKVVFDAHRGELVYVRVYNGTLTSSSVLSNVSRGGVKQKVTRLLRIEADEVTEIPSLSAGEIGAVVGLKDTSTGNTFVAASDKAPVLLEGVNVPPPVYFCSVEPESSSDSTRLETALKLLCREDPSLGTQTHAETGQLLLSGMGELHIEIASHRLADAFKLKVTLGPMKVAFRETVRALSTAHHVVDRTLGSSRMSAAVTVEVHPRNRGSGNVFEMAVGEAEAPTGVGLAWPELVEAVESGVQDYWGHGAVLGYPVVDTLVRVTRLTADSASTLPAFRLCAMQAVKEACVAEGVLLEPVMAVAVTVGEKHLGFVLSDLSGSRSADVASVDMGELEERRVSATVPLRHMGGYSSHLRSLTQGEGSFAMEFKQYSEVSVDEARALM